MIKKLKILLIISIITIFIAGVVNASLPQYWKTVKDFLPRADNEVDIGSPAKNVKAIYTSLITADSGTFDELIIPVPNTDYKFLGSVLAGGNTLALTTATGSTFAFYWFNATGDGADNMQTRLIAKGSPTDLTNSEYLRNIYFQADRRFQIDTQASGSGTVLPLWLSTGANAGQMKLLTNGDVEFTGSLTTAGIRTFGMLRVDSVGTDYFTITNQTEGDILLVDSAGAVSFNNYKFPVGTPSDNYILKYDAGLGRFAFETDATGAGGSAIVFDIGDDGGDDSTDLNEIATTGDTNNIFTLDAADKMLINMGLNWLVADSAVLADSATAFVSNPTDCGADNWATTIDANGDLTCTTVALDQLANMTGNKTFGMNNYLLKFLWTGTQAISMELEATGNFSSDLLHIDQHGGNPTGGNLLHVEAEDPDINPLVHITMDAADLTSDVVGLLIDAVDDDDVNFIPFEIRDDADNNNDLLFKIDYAGSVTTIGSITADSFSDGTLTITGGNISGAGLITTDSLSANEIVLGDDNYLWFDDAKTTGIRYESAEWADPLWTTAYPVSTEAGMYLTANLGSDGLGVGEPWFQLAADGHIEINSRSGIVSPEYQYFLITVRDSLRLKTVGDNTAIIEADNIATTDKTFQFPNITGTLVTTNGALANIDIGAYSFEADTITDGTLTITGGDLDTTGTITSSDITIFNTLPLLIFKDSNNTGDSAQGYIEWKDSNDIRLGYFGFSSVDHDDIILKNESSGGNIGIKTTGGGEFQIFAGSSAGETPELTISGYASPGSLRSLQIGVGIDGDDVASFDGLSKYYFDGNVGIGTANPTLDLHIDGTIGLMAQDGSTRGYFVARDDVGAGKAGLLIRTTSGEDINFGDGDSITNITSNLFIQGTTGNVGIGDFSPNAQLEIVSAGDYFMISTDSSASGDILKVDSAGAITFNNAFTFPNSDGNNGEILVTNGSGVLSWSAAGAGDMVRSTYDVGEDGIIDFSAGGTGLASWTQYLIPYAATTTSFGQLAIGNSGQVMTSAGGGSAPQFETLSIAAGEYAAGSITGDDINSNIAGRSLVLTGASPDTLDADAELYTHIASIVLESPVVGDDAIIQHKFPSAVTITRISASTDTGTVYFQLDERSESTPNSAGTDVLSSSLAADSNTEASTSFNNAGIAGDAILSLDVDTVSGSPTVLRIHIDYLFDD